MKSITQITLGLVLTSAALPALALNEKAMEAYVQKKNERAHLINSLADWNWSKSFIESSNKYADQADAFKASAVGKSVGQISAIATTAAVANHLVQAMRKNPAKRTKVISAFITALASSATIGGFYAQDYYQTKVDPLYHDTDFLSQGFALAGIAISAIANAGGGKFSDEDLSLVSIYWVNNQANLSKLLLSLIDDRNAGIAPKEALYNASENAVNSFRGQATNFDLSNPELTIQEPKQYEARRRLNAEIVKDFQVYVLVVYAALQSAVGESIVHADAPATAAAVAPQ